MRPRKGAPYRVLSMALDVDIFNDALNKVGQGTQIVDIKRRTLENELFHRHYYPTLYYCEERWNWSFCRKDEYIDDRYLLEGVISLPKGYLSYSMPDNTMKVLFLTDIEAGLEAETIGYKGYIPFNLRNFKDQKILVTAKEPPFVMHYQAYTDESSLFTYSFREGLVLALASRIAAALIKGSNGVSISQNLQERAEAQLQTAIQLDAQQGAYSIKPSNLPDALQSRR